MGRRQAYRAWEDHLGQAIGASEAEMVVTDVEQRVTRDDLDVLEQRLMSAMERQADRLTSLWRRDLLLIITGQFVALAGVLTAIT